ncbi:TIGR03557 family F420-dependent LLM class oxidoreductase [Patescibacteria group bacterium]|nr:TIGR03557 family F420-dependent LLM class oxidoreductase [Patescibacteria group bacterium]
MARFFFSLAHEEFQPERIVELATKVESAGFDGVAVSEHFHPWVDDVGRSGFAFSTLGAIAISTKNLTLMTSITTPLFRFHPGVVAQAAATIDRLSNGRFELGVGTGESINEIPLGYKFPNYKERAARMSEALEIIRRLFEGEKLTFKGTYYKTDRAKLYSLPIHKIPIYLAAAGPKSAKLAAEKADGIITSVKNLTETKENILDPSKNAAKAVGKPMPKIIATRWTIFAQDESEAWQALKPWRGLRVPGRDTAVNPENLRKEADSMPKKEILDKYIVVKSSEDFLDTYAPLISNIKAGTIVLQTATTSVENTIKMLGEKVLPKLKAL